MNRTRNVKLYKITVTVVALVAVALILGLLVATFPVSEQIANASTTTTTSLMSNPGTVFTSGTANAGYAGTGDSSSTYYGWNSGYDRFYEHRTQTVTLPTFSTVGDTSSSGQWYTINTIDRCTVVSDSATSYFISSSVGFEHTVSGSTMDNIMIFTTFAISDDIYNGIVNGNYIAEVSKMSASAGSTGRGDTDTWLYLGLGTAESIDAAKTYRGFNETSSIISARNDQAEAASSYTTSYTINSLYSTDAITDNITTTATQSLHEVPHSGTKYLRMGIFGELWSTYGISKLDSISLRINIYKNPSVVTNTSVPTNTNMTRPSSWVSGSQFYDNASNGITHYQQYSMYEIGNSGTNLTSSSSSWFVPSNGVINQTGWCTSTNSTTGEAVLTNISTNADSFKYSNMAQFNYTANDNYYFGFFYTLRITDNVYNALLNGKIKVGFGSESNASGIGSATVKAYSYIGIGYAPTGTSADADIYAKQGNSFVEIRGFSQNTGRNLSSGNSDTSANNTVSDIVFTQEVSNDSYRIVFNDDYSGNSNTKYIRFGLWGSFFATSGITGTPAEFSNVKFTMKLTPVTDSTSPSFSGVDSNGYANGPVTVEDSTGLASCSITDGTNTLSLDCASYGNNKAITKALFTGISNGSSYTINATDIWGNSSSKTFTYIKPAVSFSAETDGATGTAGYVGGSISFGESYGWEGSAALEKPSSDDMLFSLWAKPNTGYYFAGISITNGTTIFTSGLNYTLQSGSVPTSSGGNFVSTANQKFNYQIKIVGGSTQLNVSTIEVIAHFKAIETVGAGTYTYDKVEKTLTSSPTEAVSGFSGGSGMVASVSYTKDGVSVNSPIDVGTYTASMVIKANNIAVSQAVTETIVINKRDITATFSPENTSKVYDGSTQANANGIVGTLHNHIASDVVSVNATYTYNSKNVLEANVINVTNLTLSGAQSGNYNLTTTSATLPATITAKPISVELEAVSKVYDGTLAVDVNLVGTIELGVSGESIAQTVFSGTLDDKNVGVEKTVTLTDSLTPADGTLLSNYAFSYPELKTDVTVRPVTLTADDYTHVYDKAEPENSLLTYTVSSGSVVANDDLNVTLTKAIGVDVKEGGYVITLNAQNANYNITKVNGVCTVSPRLATVTANDVTHVYDKAEPNASELTYTLTNVVEGDSVSVTLSKESGVTVGDYDVTVVTATNSNYTFTKVSGTCTVTKRVLTVAVDDGQGHVYDGTELGGNSLSYTVTSTNKVMLGDDLGVSVEKATGVNANTYALTFNLTSLNSNYSIDATLGVTNGVYTISKRPVELKADNLGHVYDGTELGENTLTYTLVSNNLVGSDDLGLTVVKTAGVGVGEYDLTVDDGNLNANYSVSSNVKGTYTISKRPIKIQATEVSTTYTGNEPTSLAYTIAEGDLVSGDALEVTIVKELGANVGRYLLSYVFDVEAEANANYNISTVSGLYYTVNQAVLTVKYAETITFGTQPSGTLTYEGFQNGETVAVLGSSVPAVDFESIPNANKTYAGASVYVNAGTYKLTANGGTNANYTFNYVEGTLNVEQKAVTLTYAETVTYGATPSANANSAVFSYEGIVEGDTPTFTYVAGTLPTSASATPYVVDESYFTVTSLNYAVSISNTSTLTINKATVTVKAILADTTFVYGDLSFMEGVTYSYSGIKAIDDAESVKAQINPQVDFTSLLNANGYVDYSVNDYSVSPTSTATLDNYDIAFNATQFSVTKRQLTLNYKNDDVTKVYDGLKPDLSGASVEISGFASGEAFEIAYTLTNLTSVNVGTYDVYVNVADSELLKIPNYTISKINNGKYEITAREITVTVQDQIFTYGEEITVNSVFGTDFTVSNIVSGETLEVEITTDKVAGTPVGSYALDASIKGENANYVVNEVVGGHLIVNAKEITLTINAQTVDYSKTYVIDQNAYQEVVGLFGNDDLGVTISFVGQEPINVGVYNVTAVVTNGNYALTNTPMATYTVEQKALAVSVAFKNESIKLSTLKASLSEGHFTVTYVGFVEGEDESVLTTPVTVDVERIKLEAVAQADFPIYYNVGVAQNYALAYDVGVINILADKLVIDTSSLKFEDKEVEYDGENQVVEIEWAIPDGVSVSYSYTKAGVVVSESKNVGEYVVTAHFEVPETYESISDRIAHLVVTKKQATVTLTAQTSVYGEEISLDQTAYEAEGFIAGDEENVTISFENGLPINVGEYNLTATTANGNYTLAVVGGENAYSINPREITIKANDVSVVYGANIVVPQDGYTVVGSVVEGDDLKVSVTLEGAEKYVVGTTYTLVVTADNANYSFSLENGELSVAPKAINLTLNDLSVVYGESIDLSKVQYSFEEGAGEYGDVLVPTFSVTHAEKYVVEGTYLITATLDDDNYVLNAVASNLVISMRPVTITLEKQSSAYGETVVIDDTKYAVTSELGVIEGDDLNVDIILLQGANAVGNYTLTATYSNSNYHVTVVEGVYSIVKTETVIHTELYKTEYVYTGKEISIQATAESYAYTNRENPTLYVKYEVVRDAEGNLPRILEVGEYVVRVFIEESNNFLSASEYVTVHVVKATPVIDFTNLLKTTFTYNGEEQHVTVSKDDISNKELEDGQISYLNNTFKDVPDDGTLKVTVILQETKSYKSLKADVTVHVQKAYYDTSAVQFLSQEFDYDGLEHGVAITGLHESIEVTYVYGEVTQAEPFAFKDAGVYNVQATYVYDERNYNAPSFVTEATLTINRVNITVQVVDQSGYYGDEPRIDSEHIKVIAGNFVEGDEIAIQVTLEERESYPVGTYSLVATSGESGNYNVTVASGSYSVTPRPTEIIIDDATAQYGDAQAPFTYVATNAIAGDTFNANVVRESGKNVGEYVISGTFVNPNYSVTKVTNGIYTIVPRSLTIVVADQEGTSKNDISKKGYHLVGSIVRGDGLGIRVEGAIGTEPGEYPLTATYTENANYEVTVTDGIFILRLVSVINVRNYRSEKLYDGVPYVFDVSVSSGAVPQFAIEGITVENSFTEVGVYEITISAPVVGSYAAPESYTFTFEIRPTVLEAEVDGITFRIEKEDGFRAVESLVAEANEDSTLGGQDYTSKVKAAYTLYVQNGNEKITLKDYFGDKEVFVKIKLSEELANIGVATWFRDHEVNVLEQVEEHDENGCVSVSLAGVNNVVFVTDRAEATPILVVGAGMGFAFIVMLFFFIFRKKAL